MAPTRVPAPDHPYKLDPSFLIRLSATLYQRTEPIVVVLDDADAVADSPLCGQLDFLLRNAGPALRLVLLTRDDPAVSLPRHRLAGTVTEIGATDLAATPTEATELFAPYVRFVNLTNHAYEEVAGYPAAGRLASAGLDVKF